VPVLALPTGETWQRDFPALRTILQFGFGPMVRNDQRDFPRPA